MFSHRGKIVTKGASVPCASEREIFALLELEYKAPEERNCTDA